MRIEDAAILVLIESGAGVLESRGKGGSARRAIAVRR
jgi:hypothetical protein